MTTRISVNIDEEIKLKAQKIFNEMGLDMTTAINSFLRTVVREERIPYDICTERAYLEATHRVFINTALDESLLEANDPKAIRYTHKEVMANLRKQREARKHV